MKNFNKSSYHGTSSSMIQFRTTKDEGEEFPPIPSTGKTSQDSKKLTPLPGEYTPVKDLYPICSKMNSGHLLPLVMSHQQSFHLMIQHLLKSSSGLKLMQRISH